MSSQGPKNDSEENIQLQSQSVHLSNPANKSVLAGAAAGGNAINVTQNDLTNSQRADSLYSKNLEMKLPADELLHKMIQGEEDEAMPKGAVAPGGIGAQVEVGATASGKGGKSFAGAAKLDGSEMKDASDPTKLSNIQDQKGSDSIKMLCKEHQEPAVFYSQQQACYFCFKCLVTSGQLLYIDQSYKHEMEDFERIRDLTAEAVTSNIQNTTIIKNWKAKIRESLMLIR